MGGNLFQAIVKHKLYVRKFVSAVLTDACWPAGEAEGMVHLKKMAEELKVRPVTATDAVWNRAISSVAAPQGLQAVIPMESDEAMLVAEEALGLFGDVLKFGAAK